MRAWILPELLGVEAMELGEFAEPVAKRGEVVLGVLFAALNPADRYLAMGQYPAKPSFPHVLGRDGVGRVVAVGEGVEGIKVGDVRLILRSEVGVSVPGTLAERVAVEGRYTVEVPAGWSLEEAASAPLVYVTAWQAITQWGELPEKCVVLVTGASGGVGVAVTQLAHGMGFVVVGLSRSEEKGARLKEIGADFVLDPEDKMWRKRLKELLGTRRVDLAVDNIGGELFSEVMEVMGMWGRISCVGRLAGEVPRFNTASLFFKRVKIGGVAIASYTHEEAVGAWGNVLSVMKGSGARPLVDSVHEFAEVMGAFKRLAKGPMGKVVVRVGET